jgi:hypothetical protein
MRQRLECDTSLSFLGDNSPAMLGPASRWIEETFDLDGYTLTVYVGGGPHLADKYIDHAAVACPPAALDLGDALRTYGIFGRPSRSIGPKYHILFPKRSRSARQGHAAPGRAGA